MSQTLEQIAQQLTTPQKSSSPSKVQLIYAFNGTGKTRLSCALKELVTPQTEDDTKNIAPKVMYYNAFTEDLFYWDNNFDGDSHRTLKIQPNAYTQWILKEQGKGETVINHFQHYTSNKLNPRFNEEFKSKNAEGQAITVPAFSQVTFSYGRGNDEEIKNIKISKGEESIFIWSIFFTLLEQIIDVLNTPEQEDRDIDRYNKLEYVFIDDPVSSLDENNLIELAVNLAKLIKSNKSPLKFIITTHSPLFYNVLYNELNHKRSYLLERFEDGTFSLEEKKGDSNQSFSYHLHLKNVIEKAIADNQIEKFHFTLLRNLYEKTASFLGYQQWHDLLGSAPGDKDAYLKRIINFSSHRTLSNEESRNPTAQEKQTVKLLFNNLINHYGYQKKQEDDNAREN